MEKKRIDEELEEVNGGSGNDKQRYPIGYKIAVFGDNGVVHHKVVEYLGDGYYMLEITKDGITITQKVSELVITKLDMGFFH